VRSESAAKVTSLRGFPHRVTPGRFGLVLYASAVPSIATAPRPEEDFGEVQGAEVCGSLPGVDAVSNAG
jgi:hypothetical protein